MALGREMVTEINFSLFVTSDRKELPIEANTYCGEKTGTSIRN